MKGIRTFLKWQANLKTLLRLCDFNYFLVQQVAMNPKPVLASRENAYRVADDKLCCHMKFPLKGIRTFLEWLENLKTLLRLCDCNYFLTQQVAMNPKPVLASRQIVYRVVDVKLCCHMKFPLKGIRTFLEWLENLKTILLLCDCNYFLTQQVAMNPKPVLASHQIA